MNMKENWIWIKDKTENSNPIYCDKKNERYRVVSFEKKYSFEKNISAVNLRFCGDSFFRLYLNDEFIATGPAPIGGDYLKEWALGCPLSEETRRWISASSFYSTSVPIDFSKNAEQKILRFFVLVRQSPVFPNEFSRGKGGFYLNAEIIFCDGEKTEISTDETWTAKAEQSYLSPYRFDGRMPSESLPAISINNLWNTKNSPIPPCEEEEIFPLNGGKITLQSLERKKIVFEFDNIYAGYINLICSHSATIKLKIFETDKPLCFPEIILKGKSRYTGLEFLSVGRVEAEIHNNSKQTNDLTFSLFAANFPVTQQAKTTTSDDSLNYLLEICARALKYCRQAEHLDSPSHCEPLGCTGDYYIETLMTAFTFGDMRLAAFDAIKTAELIKNKDGVMFHTSYSLIWTLLVWDIYAFTGDISILSDCADALGVLLSRFEKYKGENGLIENPPDFMFVDWLIVDGYSLHHPPKALGQTCMNMFYYGALKTASKIYRKLRLKDLSANCAKKAKDLKRSIMLLLWDKNEKLFCEGLNTPTDNRLIGTFMPKNTDKKYFRKHANTLACYFGILPKRKSRDLLERIINDNSLGEMQPYFLHFLLDAVYKNGLREKYTLKLLSLWENHVSENSKGLPEGFYPPEKNYVFDRSHAWGGTPAYALPLALSGLKIENAGFKKITLSPCLCGLKSAEAEIPTPYGYIIIRMKENTPPEILTPPEIKVSIVIS